MSAEVVRYGSEAAPAPEWIPFAMLGFFVLVVLIGTAFNRRKRQFFEAITSFLPGEAGGNAFLQNFYFKGPYRGRQLLISYRPGGKNTPSRLDYSLDGPPFLFDLSLGKEDFVTSALGALGLARDIATGDQAFDSRFRIKSELPDLALRYLSLPGMRERLTALFDLGGDGLRISPGGATIPGQIKFSRRYPDLERDLGMQELNRLLALLEPLGAPQLGSEFFGAPPRRGLSAGGQERRGGFDGR